MITSWRPKSLFFVWICFLYKICCRLNEAYWYTPLTSLARSVHVLLAWSFVDSLFGDTKSRPIRYLVLSWNSVRGDIFMKPESVGTMANQRKHQGRRQYSWLCGIPKNFDVPEHPCNQRCAPNHACSHPYILRCCSQLTRTNIAPCFLITFCTTRNVGSLIIWNYY